MLVYQINDNLKDILTKDDPLYPTKDDVMLSSGWAIVLTADCWLILSGWANTVKAMTSLSIPQFYVLYFNDNIMTKNIRRLQ